MAIFRIERTKDYTVMGNFHLRDTTLSLKAKGLLSMMLSLPKDWNYTTRGLASICKEGVDSIGSVLRELEREKYIVRNRLRDKNGRILDTEYVIYEKPHTKDNTKKSKDTSSPDTENPYVDDNVQNPSESDANNIKHIDFPTSDAKCVPDTTPETALPNTDLPDTASPDTENPYMVNPDTVMPCTENPSQLNIDIINTEKLNTDISNIDSFPIHKEQTRQKRKEAIKAEDFYAYRELVLENIEYERLAYIFKNQLDDLDEIVELIVETVCAAREITRISGSDFSHEIVRSRMLKLNSCHIEYVMESLKNNTSKIRNIKQYLLTVLFNAPTTMNNSYTARLNHDMNNLNSNCS